jgi:cobalt/nickel transport system ATP-binding protein
MKTETPMIKLTDVSYAYEGMPALSNISIEIARGEAVALLGANGSGKSTLLKLINGIVPPDSGAYTFDSVEITRKKLHDSLFAKSFHQRVGFVFQSSDTQLFCADVFDEIAFGPRQMGMEEREMQKRVGECLELLGIEALRNRQPYHLSGGEKRKVAVASVLAMNPDVLTLDEPMNGLDPRTQRTLVELFVKLNKAGKTLVTSTHNLELVQELSGRSILFAEDHTVAADMPTEDLLKDMELLKRVNLVDEFYHQHVGKEHSHFHTHML